MHLCGPSYFYDCMDRDCLKPFARAETNRNSVNFRLVKASNSNAYTNAIHFPDINIVMS